MQPRILDLDGSLLAQDALLRRISTPPLPVRSWAPRIRLACRWAVFRAFEAGLRELVGLASDPEPCLSFCGSGDFHHVSLALLRRLRTPCNLLILDKHPDWMRGLPFLHCGTWLYHAAALPHVGRIFHVGGELDFDNRYHWLAPWRWLRSGKITVLPAARRFQGRRWSRIAHQPLRSEPDTPADGKRVERLIDPFRKELAARPLYVSLDKDVLAASEAPANWDSGRLQGAEVLQVVGAFAAAAGGRLAGVDVVGDWSPVQVCGLFRQALHWTEHPALWVDDRGAAALHERLNLAVLQAAAAWCGADKRHGLRLCAA
jgi:hypothetical protein